MFINMNLVTIEEFKHSSSNQVYVPLECIKILGKHKSYTLKLKSDSHLFKVIDHSFSIGEVDIHHPKQFESLNKCKNIHKIDCLVINSSFSF